MEKENKTIIILAIVMIIAFILSCAMLHEFSNQDKQTYQTCLKTYDSKTCDKLVYGKY